MCPRCYLGASLKAATRHSPQTIAAHSSSQVKLAKILLPPPLWVQIFTFSHVRATAAMMRSCKTIKYFIDTELFWELMCRNTWKCNLDVFFIKPNLECPEHWKDYYWAQLKRTAWMQSVKGNIDAFPAYFMTYSKLRNRHFGKARIFSRNSIHLIATSMLSLQLTCDQIETLPQHSYSKTCHTLSSGAIVDVCTSDFKILTGEMEFSHTLRDDCEAQCNADSFLIGAIISNYVSTDSKHGCDGQSNVIEAALSYADVAEVLSLGLLSPPSHHREGSCNITLHGMKSATECDEMPFEIYYVHLQCED